MAGNGGRIRPRVAVIGGGITGLVAVHHLLNAEPRVDVVLYERSATLGGKIRTASLGEGGELTAECGPDGFVNKGSEIPSLCETLGVHGELVASAPGGVSLWSRGRLRRLPSSLVMGLPVDPMRMLGSGILRPHELLRVAFDLVLPRTSVSRDLTVAELIGTRMGRAVVERLVEPLLGGIYAGSADLLGVDAALPGLRARLGQRRSLIRVLRAGTPGVGAGVSTLRGGLERLTDALHRDAARRGAAIRLRSPVAAIHPSPSRGYELLTADGVPDSVDAVVVAAPAGAAAAMLRSLSPAAAGALELIPYASVAVVSLLYPSAGFTVPPQDNGFLVPRGEARLLRACTWTTTKWPHLARDGVVLARCSVGSFTDHRPAQTSDDALVHLVHGELQVAVGVTLAPYQALVTRWDQAMPQYVAGHRDHVAAVRAALPPGVILAGAACEGVGLSACAAQGRGAAESALAHVAARARPERPAPMLTSLTSTATASNVPRGPSGSGFDQRPILVFWETTRACPLACRHCRAEAQHEPLPGELSFEEGLSLIDQVAEFGIPRPVLILTGGDCFQRPDLERLVSHARSRGMHVAISPSVTPGLVTERLVTLRQLGVKVASLSLDGATPTTHDGIRGVAGHYDQTIEAMRVLRSLGFTLQINTTVMTHNVMEMADIAAVVHWGGAKIWEVFFLVAVGRGVSSSALQPLDCKDVCHMLVDASRHGLVVRTVEAPFFRRVAATRRRGLAPLDDAGPLYAHLAARLEAQLGAGGARQVTPTTATRDGSGVVFVAHDGTILPSGFLPVALGNVRSDSLVDIYRTHPLLQQIRLAHFHGRCGACAYRHTCGGSRARAYAATGDPLGEDPACDYTPEHDATEAGVANAVG